MYLNVVEEVLLQAAKRRVVSSFLLWGTHGIGKTSIIPQVAKKLNYKYRNFRASQVDPTEILGFPSKQTKVFTTHDADGNEISSSTEVLTYAHPEWFEQARHGNFILFLDEVNRAKPDVQNTLFELVQERTLGGVPLPDTVLIVAGNNPASGKYHTFESDEAWMDRFIHLKVESNFNVWVDNFARKTDRSGKANISREIIEFLAKDKSSEMFHHKDESENLTPFEVHPTPRSWQKVHEILGLRDVLSDDVLHEVIQGVVGPKVATAFMVDIRSGKKPITLDEVFELSDMTKEKIREYSEGVIEDSEHGSERHVEVSLLNQTCEELVREENSELVKQYSDKVMAFFELLPEAMSQKTLQKLCKQNKNKKFWHDKLMEPLLDVKNEPVMTEVDGHPQPVPKWSKLLKSLEELRQSRKAIQNLSKPS